MYKWKVFYRNPQNNDGASFLVKASNKTQAIEQAILRVEKKFYRTDRFLNNYSITRVI